MNIGSSVIFISTDYVFDGESPPYKPEDKVNPLNKYGLMKAEGEKIVLQQDAGIFKLRYKICLN